MLKIKLIFLGYPPHGININKIQTWKSKLFEVITPIGQLSINSNADLDEWGFSDANIDNMLPNDYDWDLLIAITSVPLEDNYYARRLSGNRVCVSFFEISDFLKSENIPLENFILRMLYSTGLVYQRYNRNIPEVSEATNFTHDETKGCIFDMNGIKNEIIYSANVPIVCEACIHSLLSNRIESNLIDSIKDELKGVKKSLYYRLSDLVKLYPVCAIVFSSLVAIILGVIGSLIASYLWALISK